MLLISFYLLVVLLLTYRQWKGARGSVFQPQKKVPWWISGLSLYMLFLSVDQGQLISGIISEHGMQGMWMVWAGNLGVFVVPLVFAPLWHKLNLATDNQFILFRFPGKAGAWLHRFRAIYVGGLVVTLAVSFHLIGFARVIQVFYGLSPVQSTCIGGGIMLLFAVKNVLDIKLKLDVLHTVLFITSFFAVVFFVGKEFIFEKDWMRFLVEHPAKRSLFPSDTSAWFSMVIYLGVQWWSCYLFDGGGAETSRFTAVKTPKDAIKAGLTPILISFLLSFFMVIHVVALLGYSAHSMPGELAYVSSLVNLLPSYSKDIVFLGFFAMFITTAESLLNWGASFLVIDAWNGWLNPNKKQKEHRSFSIVMMLALSLLSVLVALNVSNLLELIKITFSISAGVAPVFILRWIWFRINAWSQLSAMLSSGVFTLIYPYLHENSPLRQLPLEESRILVVTLLTTVTWITVTLISTNQSKTVEEKLLPIIGSRKQIIFRLSMALMLGITLTYCTYAIWHLILA